MSVTSEISLHHHPHTLASPSNFNPLLVSLLFSHLGASPRHPTCGYSTKSVHDSAGIPTRISTVSPNDSPTGSSHTFQLCSNSSLSVELYSDPAHFVLELIQNLDDTAYPPNVTPTATFQLDGKTLTVESNQSGFTEADVLSICDMGQSSKLPASGIVKDSIGEKGIGRVPSIPPSYLYYSIISHLLFFHLIRVIHPIHFSFLPPSFPIIYPIYFITLSIIC
jgi:hypothetical protein